MVRAIFCFALFFFIQTLIAFVRFCKRNSWPKVNGTPIKATYMELGKGRGAYQYAVHLEGSKPDKTYICEMTGMNGQIDQLPLQVETTFRRCPYDIHNVMHESSVEKLKRDCIRNPLLCVACLLLGVAALLIANALGF